MDAGESVRPDRSRPSDGSEMAEGQHRFTADHHRSAVAQDAGEDRMRLKVENDAGREFELSPNEEDGGLYVVVRDQDVWALMTIDKEEALRIAEFLKRWAES